jgi:hypothetical protein
MSKNRIRSRWTFMHPSYAASPLIFHWLANTVGVVSLAGPYLTVLVPCFSAVWGANQLQLSFGATAYGTISALMSMIKIGAMIFSIEMLFTTYHTRHEWEEVVRRIIHGACEESLQAWRR